MSYGELIGDKFFDIKFTGTAPRKPSSEYSLVGTRVPRVDIPDKVRGAYTHMQHVRVAGMLHGRIVRPRGQGAYGDGARVKEIDESSIADIPGARVVRRRDLVGVVAEQEWDAVRAAEQNLRRTFRHFNGTNPFPGGLQLPLGAGLGLPTLRRLGVDDAGHGGDVVSRRRMRRPRSLPREP